MPTLEELSVEAIPMRSTDAVRRADSGHPDLYEHSGFTPARVAEVGEEVAGR